MPTAQPLAAPDVVALLKASPNRDAAALASNGELVKAMVALSTSTLKFACAAADGDVVSASVALLEKGTALSDSVAAGSRRYAKTSKVVTMVSSNFVETIGLAEIAAKASMATPRVTPAGAAIFVSAMTAKKLLMMAGITDQKLLSQCQLALLSMSATAATTAISAPTGVGLVVGSLALMAEVVNAGMQCSAEGLH